MKKRPRQGGPSGANPAKFLFESQKESRKAGYFQEIGLRNQEKIFGSLPRNLISFPIIPHSAAKEQILRYQLAGFRRRQQNFSL